MLVKHVLLYSSNTNVLRYEHQLCLAPITRTCSIKDLSVFFDSKLYFYNNVDFIFSECIKLLGLIRSITFRISSLDTLYVLYFTLVRSKLEYASVVWNSITSINTNKLLRIQQRFASVSFYRSFRHVPCRYTLTLDKLNQHPQRKRRHHLGALFFFLFRPVAAFNLALSSWKILVFMFLLAMLGTSQSLVFVPQRNIVLLGAPMLPAWWLKISTYLRSERFLSIIINNLVRKIVNNILGFCSKF
jgi:hypothetical protein